MSARRTAYEKSRAISSFANKSVIQIPCRVTLDRLQVVEEKRIIISLVKFVALFLVTAFIAFDTKCTCRRFKDFQLGHEGARHSALLSLRSITITKPNLSLCKRTYSLAHP